MCEVMWEELQRLEHAVVETIDEADHEMDALFLPFLHAIHTASSGIRVAHTVLGVDASDITAVPRALGHRHQRGPILQRRFVVKRLPQQTFAGILQAVLSKTGMDGVRHVAKGLGVQLCRRVPRAVGAVSEVVVVWVSPDKEGEELEALHHNSVLVLRHQGRVNVAAWHVLEPGKKNSMVEDGLCVGYGGAFREAPWQLLEYVCAAVRSVLERQCKCRTLCAFLSSVSLKTHSLPAPFCLQYPMESHRKSWCPLLRSLRLPLHSSPPSRRT